MAIGCGAWPLPIADTLEPGLVVSGGNAVHGPLDARVRGKVVTPGHPLYADARRVWNARFDRYPAAIVFVEGPDDVAAALDHAATLELPVAVRAGGHSPAGWSSSEGGLVIDLRRLDEITAGDDGTVIVGGGVIVADLVRWLDARNLALPVGTCAGVGIAGLTLGGGLGHLNGRHGLTCDNLRWAEIVLPDGSCHIVSPDRQPDLFWAICGAGANFGIVTRLAFQTHVTSRGFGGVVAFQDQPTAGIVSAFRELCDGAPDDLGAELKLLTTDAGVGASVSVFWSGDARDGEDAVSALRQLGRPVAGRLGTVRYASLAALDDSALVRRAYYQRSANLPALDEAEIAAIVDRDGGTGGSNFMTLIHRRHGLSTRLAAGAYPHRSPAFETTFAVSWTPGRDAAALRRRVDLAWSAVGGEGLPVYVNMLDDEGPSRIAAAYGSSRDRLSRLKGRYDPCNRLRGNANIPPVPARVPS